MADALTDELIKKSVTGGDVFNYTPGSGGVVNFIMPYFWGGQSTFALPTELPAYYTTGVYSYPRDVILRSTILHEPQWANAVSIAASKAASKSFKVDGAAPRKVKDAHEMMVQWGGDGYVPSQKRGVIDYSCTNNGEFWEIVRSSSAAGSRIVGMVHLDSLRCRRTGDPSIPVIYFDLHGRIHELKYYQVFSIVDMPDPSYPRENIGHCAAERAYSTIYEMAGLRTTINEKITGSGAHQLAVLQGMSPTQIKDILKTAEFQAQAKGLVYYQGTIFAAIAGDATVDIKTLQLRGLPENFDVKTERDNANLIYANALGLVLTDLQPLSGQGLGTGAQTIVIEEKASGRTLASRDKELTHQLNEWVMPDAVTFAWSEKDTRDEQATANVSLTRAQTRAAQIASGEITAQQALQMAVDADDAPKEFLPVDATPDQSVSDEDRSDEATETEPVVNVVSPDAQTGIQPAKQVDAQQVSNAVEAVQPTLNLNGAQVQAVMGIVSSVNTGQITRENGSNMLQIMFHLTPDQADRMLGAVQTSPATTPPVTPTTPQAVTKEVDEVEMINAMVKDFKEGEGHFFSASLENGHAYYRCAKCGMVFTGTLKEATKQHGDFIKANEGREIAALLREAIEESKKARGAA